MSALVLPAQVMMGLNDAAKAAEMTREDFAIHAIRMLAARYGVDIPEPQPSPIRRAPRPATKVKTGRKRKAVTWPMEHDVPTGYFARVCPWCKRQFRTDKDSAVYCSKRCKAAMQNLRAYEKRRKRPSHRSES